MRKIAESCVSGSPVVVSSNAIMGCAGYVELVADTDHPELKKFTVGRVLGEKEELTVILPSGSWVKANYLLEAYDDVLNFLSVWEDFELEHNGNFYGGYLEIDPSGKWIAIQTELAEVEPTGQNMLPRKRLPLNRLSKDKLPEWLNEPKVTEVRVHNRNPWVSAIEGRLDGVVTEDS